MDIVRDKPMEQSTKSDFKRLWTREAVNQPGIMVETVALTKEPILRKPVMRKTA